MGNASCSVPLLLSLLYSVFASLFLSLFVVLALFHSMTSFVMVLIKFWQLVHCILQYPMCKVHTFPSFHQT